MPKKTLKIAFLLRQPGVRRIKLLQSIHSEFAYTFRQSLGKSDQKKPLINNETFIALHFQFPTPQ